MGAAFALVSFTLVSFALLWLCIVHVALMLVTLSGLGPGPVLLSTLSLRLLWSCSTSWLHSSLVPTQPARFALVRLLRSFVESLPTVVLPLLEACVID